MVLITAALVLLATAILWLLTRGRAQPEPAAGPPSPDPIAEQIDKWMHDWDRGRA